MTNFHISLIKQWWQFSQVFVYGDVVMLRIWRYWPWKTVKVSSHLYMPVRPTLLHRGGPRFFSTVRFVTIWATCRIFWANGLPPPPPCKNFPYACANCSNKLQVNDIPGRRKTLILRAPPRIFIEAKRTSSYLAIIIISSSFIPHNYFFPWKRKSKFR